MVFPEGEVLGRSPCCIIWSLFLGEGSELEKERISVVGGALEKGEQKNGMKKGERRMRGKG